MSSPRVFIVVSQPLVMEMQKQCPERFLGVGSCLVGQVDADGQQLFACGQLFPMVLDGMATMRELPAAKIYSVTNDALCSDRPGINFRSQPSWTASAKDEMLLAFYGSQVGGVPYGEGWLKVGNLFLPMKVKGKRVLELADGSTCADTCRVRTDSGANTVSTGAPSSEEGPPSSLGSVRSSILSRRWAACVAGKAERLPTLLQSRGVSYQKNAKGKQDAEAYGALMICAPDCSSDC